jgi:hypothetical protein
VRGRRGPRGLPGERGAQGPQGPQGPAGTAGAAGATNVTVRSGPLEPGISVAECNPGERAVGGGGTAPDGGWLWDSEPTEGSGETPTGWIAQADTVDVDDAGNETFTDVNVQAWVVCAAP